MQRASQILRDPHRVALTKTPTPARLCRSTNGTEQNTKQDLGFLARVFAQMGLPHSDPGDHVKTFERRNGIYRLKLTADEESHLPYGSIPRVLLAFVGTEAVRTRSREIYLGKNLSEFLRDKLHMQVSGGARGTITVVREQAWRLFTCTISVSVETAEEDDSTGA